MRPITSHAINPANEALKVVALDGPGPGGASHKYAIEIPTEVGKAGFRNPETGAWINCCVLNFQNGPVNQEVAGYKCSNPACGKVHEVDPHDHCPACRVGDSGWSTFSHPRTIGVNGITHEAVLAVLIDRLEGFQGGPYANKYNEAALFSLRDAMSALHARTREREARGVEGTHKV